VLSRFGRGSPRPAAIIDRRSTSAQQPDPENEQSGNQQDRAEIESLELIGRDPESDRFPSTVFSNLSGAAAL
jgi:hypothetical protein